MCRSICELSFDLKQNQGTETNVAVKIEKNWPGSWLGKSIKDTCATCL